MFNREIFNEIEYWWDGVKDYKKMAEFYDFIEISPARREEEKSINQRIIQLGKVFKIPVVATSNAKHLTVSYEKLVKETLYSYVPMCERYNHMYSTDELLDEFSYLGEDVAYDVVIKNPKIIADMCF